MFKNKQVIINAIRYLKENGLQLFLLKTHRVFQENKQDKIVACIEKGKKSVIPPLSKETLNIGFFSAGGIGDHLIFANYLYYFRKKFGDKSTRIDVFYSSENAKTVLKAGEVINYMYQVSSKLNLKEYDLIIMFKYCPIIVMKNDARINKMRPILATYCEMCKEFQNKHVEQLESMENTIILQKEFLSKGRMRLQQADLNGFLGISRQFAYRVFVNEDENKYLSLLNLYKKTYITIHRGCDMLSVKNSTKLWPLEYYNQLIALIKKKYPQIIILQLGVTHKRCPSMEHIDINMVEKTSIDQIKVLLKNSRLHIDGEGGLVHLRKSLCENKSVVLFGSTSKEFFGYDNNINIRGKGCSLESCEWKKENWQEVCYKGYKEHPCMYSLKPESVFEEIDKSIESILY